MVKHEVYWNWDQGKKGRGKKNFGGRKTTKATTKGGSMTGGGRFEGFETGKSTR